MSEEEQFPFYKQYKNLISKILKIPNTNITPQKNFEPYSKKIKEFLDSFSSKPTTSSASKSKTKHSKKNGDNCKIYPSKMILCKMFEQIIKYKNGEKFNYILKRSCLCNVDPKTLETKSQEELLKDVNIKEFINNCLKEYFFNRITSAHPSGVLANDFEITILLDKNCIIFELLLEYGGKSLREDYFDDNSGEIKPECKKNAFRHFKELIYSLKFLERRNLAHMDIKLDNILIDDSNKIRLIDFDIASEKGFLDSHSVTKVNRYYGYTNEYVSPEILEYEQYKNSEKKSAEVKQLNSWKSDIYSCGISALIMSGAFPCEMGGVGGATPTSHSAIGGGLPPLGTL